MSADGARFRHEALLYAGEEQLVRCAAPVIRAAVGDGQPVMVVLDAGKIERLRAALRADAAGVEFADMGGVGLNPARLIPLWADFVEQRGGEGRPLLGVGEPVWRGRSPAELDECDCHEALLNVAFGGIDGFRLVCPYDTAALGGLELESARRTHPCLVEHGRPRVSDAFGTGPPPCTGPLPEPGASAEPMGFGPGDLTALRAFVAGAASAAGILGARADDLRLAVHEAATNSVRHGGGAGTLRTWMEEDALVCEVRDDGRIHDPLAGRRSPRGDRPGGHGLWIIQQVCDLAQVRSSAEGTVVRMRMRRT